MGWSRRVTHAFAALSLDFHFRRGINCITWKVATFLSPSRYGGEGEHRNFLWRKNSDIISWRDSREAPQSQPNLIQKEVIEWLPPSTCGRIVSMWEGVGNVGFPSDHLLPAGSAIRDFLIRSDLISLSKMRACEASFDPPFSPQIS